MTRIQRVCCRDCFLRCTEVVNRRVKAHVRFEVDAIPEMVHDLVHAALEESPSGGSLAHHASNIITAHAQLGDRALRHTHVPWMSSLAGMATIPLASAFLDILSGFGISLPS